jgi:hypothetical protein
MATEFTVPPIHYDSRDYESIVADLINLIPFFTPEWTDHNPSDFGIVLVQQFAAMGDVIHFYIDRAAGEAFLPTAIKRESVINLLKLIDYQMSGATASSVDLTFATATTLLDDIDLPAGTQCQTAGADPVFFETTVATSIPAGSLDVVVGAVEGASFEENPLGISTGTAFQRFIATNNPIIDASIQVFVKEGAVFEEWTRVDSFIDSTASSGQNYRRQQHHLRGWLARFGLRDQREFCFRRGGSGVDRRCKDPGASLVARTRPGRDT